MVNNDNTEKHISPKTLVCVLLGFFTFSYSLNKKKNITRRIEFDRKSTEDRSRLNNTVVDSPFIRIVVEKEWLLGAACCAWET